MIVPLPCRNTPLPNADPATAFAPPLAPPTTVLPLSVRGPVTFRAPPCCTKIAPPMAAPPPPVTSPPRPAPKPPAAPNAPAPDKLPAPAPPPPNPPAAPGSPPDPVPPPPPPNPPMPPRPCTPAAPPPPPPPNPPAAPTRSSVPDAPPAPPPPAPVPTLPAPPPPACAPPSPPAPPPAPPLAAFVMMPGAPALLLAPPVALFPTPPPPPDVPAPLAPAPPRPPPPAPFCTGHHRASGAAHCAVRRQRHVVDGDDGVVGDEERATKSGAAAARSHRAASAGAARGACIPNRQIVDGDGAQEDKEPAKLCVAIDDGAVAVDRDRRASFVDRGQVRQEDDRRKTGREADGVRAHAGEVEIDDGLPQRPRSRVRVRRHPEVELGGRGCRDQDAGDEKGKRSEHQAVMVLTRRTTGWLLGRAAVQ